MVKRLNQIRLEHVVWAWMLIFLIADLVFYRQRLYQDASYYLFQIISDKTFNIEHLRPVSVFTQWIPLIMTHLEAPADWIMIAYSFNEWLYFFIFFIIFFYIRKDQAAVTALMAVMVLVNKENWYNPVSELIQGAPFLILTVSLFREKSFKPVHYLLTLFSLALVIQSHPLQFLGVPMMLGISFIYAEKPDFKRYIFAGLITVIMVILRYFQFDEYENNPQGFPPFDPSTWKVGPLIEYFLKHFTGFVILTTLTAVYLWRNSRRKEAFFLFAGTILYICFVFYKTGNLFSENYEAYERYIFPLSLVAGWSFGYWFIEPKVKIGRLTAVGFWAVLLFAELVLLFTVRMHYLLGREQNINRWVAYLSQFKEQKFLVKNEHFFYRHFGHDWALLNEVMLVSASKGRAIQVILPRPNKPELIKQVSENKNLFLYSGWDTQERSRFNRTYFDFQPSEVRNLNVDTVRNDRGSDFFKNIKLTVDLPKFAVRNAKYYFPIQIINRNNVPLYSGQKFEQLKLSYRWESDGKVLNRSPEKTLLTADVYGTLTQEIAVKMPPKSGNYTLKVDLYFENSNKWCGSETKYKVKVW